MSLADGLEELYAVFQDRYFGKYPGEVVNNSDDENRGRLLVKVPDVMGDQELWALPCIPYAGKDVGFYAMPPEKANVWVEFLGGDPNHPIWVGSFWAKDQTDSADTKPGVKFLRTEGAVIRIDDDAGTVTIETGDGTVMTIGGGEIKLEATDVSASANGSKLALSSGGLDVNNGAFSVS